MATTPSGAGLSSSLWLSNGITVISRLPLMGTLSRTLFNTTQAFYKASEKEETRFAAIACSIMTVASGIWTIKLIYKITPVFPCIKRALFPTIEFALKCWLGTVIFHALKSLKSPSILILRDKPKSPSEGINDEQPGSQHPSPHHHISSPQRQFSYPKV